MMEEQAVVLRVEHDQTYLEIVRRSPCGLCGQTRGCGVSIWGKLFGHRTEFRAANPIDAKTGDSVVVGIEEQALLRSALVAYGVPLLTVIAGALLGTWLVPAQDLAAVLGAAAGLVSGLAWLRIKSAQRRHDGRFQPVILRRAQDCGKGSCHV